MLCWRFANIMPYFCVLLLVWCTAMKQCVAHATRQWDRLRVSATSQGVLLWLSQGLCVTLNSCCAESQGCSVMLQDCCNTNSVLTTGVAVGAVRLFHRGHPCHTAPSPVFGFTSVLNWVKWCNDGSPVCYACKYTCGQSPGAHVSQAHPLTSQVHCSHLYLSSTHPQPTKQQHTKCVYVCCCFLVCCGWYIHCCAVSSGLLFPGWVGECSRASVCYVKDEIEMAFNAH